MTLQERRKQRNLTQRELAQRSGVNFRSLQDYEQGHKKLMSASGDILLRLSTALGCTTEELLLEDVRGAPLLEANRLDVETIQSQRFYSDQYKTFGRWVCGDHSVATMFYYDGKLYLLPFRAVFTWATLPGLKAAAVLQMEAQIEERLTDDFESW